MYFNSIAKKQPTTAKRPKKPVVEISSDRETEENQGNLTNGKVQLAAADLLAVEEGKCLQDVHTTAANVLLKQHSLRELASSQLCIYRTARLLHK